jgi:hypothetical protein
MSNDPWWAQSPIFVVPLSFLALGIVLVPFAVAGTDHAAQFYGSFVAAIVAAGAVVGTTTLQAHLAHNESRRIRREAFLSEALELYAWLSELAGALSYVADVLDRWTKIIPAPTLTAESLRSNLHPDARERLRAHIGIASRLQSPLGQSTLNLLHRIDGVLDTIAYQPLARPETVFEIPGVKTRGELALFYSRMVRWHRAELGKFLVENGVINSLDLFDIQALAAGQPNLVQANAVFSAAAN